MRHIYTAMTINGNFSQSEVMQMASLTSHEFIENAFTNLISINFDEYHTRLNILYYFVRISFIWKHLISIMINKLSNSEYTLMYVNKPQEIAKKMNTTKDDFFQNVRKMRSQISSVMINNWFSFTRKKFYNRAINCDRKVTRCKLGTDSSPRIVARNAGRVSNAIFLEF